MLQPFFELWEDASAMAEFDSSRLGGDNRYDEVRNCWCAKDGRGRIYRFEIEEVAAKTLQRNRQFYGPAQSILGSIAVDHSELSSTSLSVTVITSLAPSMATRPKNCRPKLGGRFCPCSLLGAFT